jgi:hypothetical protein
MIFTSSGRQIPGTAAVRVARSGTAVNRWRTVMLPIKRALTATGLGLTFLMVSAGAGHATVTAPSSAPTRVIECNADPGMDPSNDPKHCSYQHPLPDTHWWRHKHY